MLKYKILNKYIRNKTTRITTDVSTQNILAKTITIPFSSKNRDDGYSDLSRELFLTEREKINNTIIDNETLKFNNADSNNGEITDLKIQVFFQNTTSIDFPINSFCNDFKCAGFEEVEIESNRNNFKNSFFRIDFYDSPNQREQNFLFSETVSISGPSSISDFNLNQIFYKMSDPKFTEENTFVELYFEILFFNAKTGVVSNLINSPTSQVLTLSQYNANPSWRFAKIKILNPYNEIPNVGSLNKLFYVEPINGNTSQNINFSQLIIV